MNAHWPTAANNPNATGNEIKYSNWYNTATKAVVSTTMETGSNVRVIKDNLLQEIKQLKEQQGKDMLVFGSPTLVHSLLELDLIDHIWLIVHPVFFGNGIPLFGTTEKITKLQLLASEQLSNGTLCNKYSISK